MYECLSKLTGLRRLQISACIHSAFNALQLPTRSRVGYEGKKEITLWTARKIQHITMVPWKDDLEKWLKRICLVMAPRFIQTAKTHRRQTEKTKADRALRSFEGVDSATNMRMNAPKRAISSSSKLSVIQIVSSMLLQRFLFSFSFYKRGSFSGSRICRI